LLQTNLFRPPYGRLSPKLARIIAKKYKIIMWTWLSYDYDASVSVEEIMKQAKKIEAGHILVLHDNAKIAEKQKELFPKLIQFLKEENFSFGEIS
jgi:peptidoglycan/xylan/chitin deacetylase (PgdA/CDA1 family)